MSILEDPIPTTPAPGCTWVDSKPLVAACVDALARQPMVAIDFEGMTTPMEARGFPTGVDYSKCALATFGVPGATFVVDVFGLTEDVWDWHGTTCKDASLKSILQDSSVPKLMWDCRYDNNTLVLGHGIKLANVWDLQVGVAYKNPGFRFVPGLHGKTLAGLGAPRRMQMEVERVSTTGRRVWRPRDGGDFTSWRTRPIQSALVEYSGQDVELLFTVMELLAKSGIVMTSPVLQAVTDARLAESSTSAYDATSKSNRDNPFAARGRGRGMRW